MNLWLEFHLSAIAKTIPASVARRMSPENLGSVISYNASATCNTQSTETETKTEYIILSSTCEGIIHKFLTKKKEKIPIWNPKRRNNN